MKLNTKKFSKDYMHEDIGYTIPKGEMFLKRIIKRLLNKARRRDAKREISERRDGG